MKNNTFKEYIAPVIVLVCICLGMSLALAVVYGITKPIIDTNSKAAADATRGALLPEAEKQFAVYDGDLVVEQENAVYVSECYVAENKSGMVCTVITKSFGGALTMMVGIDSEGAVTGVAVTEHADTPGLGTKDFEEGYLSQYKGLTELKSTSVKDDGQIDYISGASVSGGAVHYGVYAALHQYEEMGGVQ